MRTVPSKKAFIALTAGFAFCAGLLVLVLFPIHQSVSTWKGYRVLAVSGASGEPEILGLLDKAGIRDIVSESNSIIPSGDPQSPVLPFLSDVNTERARWFSDKAEQSRLLYLEEIPFLDAKIQKAFFGSNFSWNLERSGSFSIIPVFCAGFLLLAGALTTKRKGFVLACGIPFVIFAASCNDRIGFLTAAVACIVLLLNQKIFFAESIGVLRKRLPAIIRSRPFQTLSVPLPFIISILGGIQHTLLFVAATILATTAGLLCSFAEEALRAVRDAKRLHPAFRPVGMVPPGPGLDIDRKRLTIMAAVCVLTVATGVISPAIPKKSSEKDKTEQELYIPAPTGYTARNGFTVEGFKELCSLKTETDLPDLSDFITTRWNIRIYPWKKIRSPLVRPEPGDALDEVRYSADSSGKITSERETIDTFDSGFIRKSLSSDGTPLERLLARQGRFVSVTFKRLMR